MTFTVMARCEETGQMGMCTTSFSPIAGSRVPWLQAERGILVVMAFAAPALVLFGGRLLEQGWSAPHVLDALRRNDAFPEHRQIGVIDAHGRNAVNTGKAAVPFAGHRRGSDYVVLGNVVASERVIDAMQDGFVGSAGQPLSERLLRGIEAGRDAGGQLDGQRSAFIKLVAPGRDALLIDLRVDLHDEPVGALRAIHDRSLARGAGQSAISKMVTAIGGS